MESSHGEGRSILTFLSGTAWQDDAEASAVAFPTLEVDPAAVGFDGPARDGKPEPNAAVVPGARVIDTIEAIEDSLTMRGRDQDGGV